MTEEKQVGIPRIRMITAEDIREHVRAVGRSIIADADKLNIEPQGTIRVEICVKIEPSIEVTTIDWTIERIADPRVAKNDN